MFRESFVAGLRRATARTSADVKAVRRNISRAKRRRVTPMSQDLMSTKCLPISDVTRL